MSSFDEYRRTQVDMLHLVSHLMRLHKEPGHWESTPEQRDAYDHIHHSFMDTVHVAYARLSSIGKAPDGVPSRLLQQARTRACVPHSARSRSHQRWPDAEKRQRNSRQADAVFKRRGPVGDPFPFDGDAPAHPPAPGVH